MIEGKRFLQLDIFDYSGHKLCNLYDSEAQVSGQASDIVQTTERNGWKEFSFSIPAKINTDGVEEDKQRIS